MPIILELSGSEAAMLALMLANLLQRYQMPDNMRANAESVQIKLAEAMK